MCGDKRSVDRTPRDFLAAWGRGDAGPVPCGACTACCYYPGIVVDERRDSKRLAHLLTERSPEGELVLQRRPDGACVHLGERGCTVYEQRPGPAARVTLLSSGGRRDGAPAADLPPFPDRARRCRSGRTGRSRNTPIRVPTGYSRWRRVQICRGPPSSASRGLSRAAHARPAATTRASSWTRSAIGSAWPQSETLPVSGAS
jgi:hypothetical protein